MHASLALRQNDRKTEALYKKRSRGNPAPRHEKGVITIRTIVFVDFDGTITMEDTLAGAMRRFVPKEEFDYYSRKLIAGEATLSQVVRRACDGAPSAIYPQLLEYVRSVPMRPGFDRFLDVCDEAGIGVVVISGGVRAFLDEKLKPYEGRLLGVHAAELDVSGPEMRLISEFDDGNELVKKTAVMALYDYDYAIGVGDSFTDRSMATAVDWIFARDVLARYLASIGKDYTPYEDFYAVVASISSSR